MEHMLRIAAGQPLPARLLAHRDGCVPAAGWAVESRVYAEDPFRGFMPSPGTLVSYREPDVAVSRQETDICMWVRPW